MRKRSVGINVRVSVTEKRKMTLMAKRCGLSLSEYLRQRALGYEPGGHPPKEVFDVLDKIDEMAVIQWKGRLLYLYLLLCLR